MIDCPEPDFSAARALNRESLMRFTQERSIIAALNDRLAVLIDMVRLGVAALCQPGYRITGYILKVPQGTTLLLLCSVQKAYYAFVKVIYSFSRAN